MKPISLGKHINNSERKNEVLWPDGMDAGKAKSTDAHLDHLPAQFDSFSYVYSFSKGHHVGWNLQVTSDTSLWPAPNTQTDVKSFLTP